MKNILIAIALAALLGLGFYYFKSSSNHDGGMHSHDGGEQHSH